MALYRKNIGNNKAIGTYDTSYTTCAAGLQFISRVGIDSLRSSSQEA